MRDNKTIDEWKKDILSVDKVIAIKESKIINILFLFNWSVFKKIYAPEQKKIFDMNDPATSFSKGPVGIPLASLKPNKSIKNFSWIIISIDINIKKIFDINTKLESNFWLFFLKKKKKYIKKKNLSCEIFFKFTSS